VKSGRFGACLMAEPELVAECVAAMREATPLPVTVKHRIGIDRDDGYAALAGFVETVAQAGCDAFIVHARKAWLQGLSPKENREIPPLRPNRVYRLKQDFPTLQIIFNGGVQDLGQAAAHLRRVDGCMIGRAAYHDPWLLADADRLIFGDDRRPPSRRAVVLGMRPYIEQLLRDGGRLHHLTRHMLGLFQGLAGARHWRRHLSEQANRPDAGWDTLIEAMREIREPARPPLEA
jgi:tRNA-dihydrouridine synthase A